MAHASVHPRKYPHFESARYNIFWQILKPNMSVLQQFSHHFQKENISQHLCRGTLMNII